MDNKPLVWDFFIFYKKMRNFCRWESFLKAGEVEWGGGGKEGNCRNEGCFAWVVTWKLSKVTMILEAGTWKFFYHAFSFAQYEFKKLAEKTAFWTCNRKEKVPLMVHAFPPRKTWFKIRRNNVATKN